VRAVVPRAVGLLAAGALLAGCGGAGGGPSIVERDSAGVTIVENPPLDGASMFAGVGPTPLVEIGALEGEPEYQLFDVRDAHRFADGRLAIANGGSYQIRFYDPSGRYRRSVGGEGDGPGEFRSIYALHPRPADSLWVFDTRHWSFIVLDSAGAFVRTWSFGSGNGFRFPRGVFPDGTALVQGVQLFTAGETSSGLQRTPVDIALFAPDGTPAGSLGERPGNEMFVWTANAGMAVRGLAFGRQLFTVVAGDRAVIGSNDERSFAVVRRTGDIERIVRVAGPLDPVEPGDFDRYVEEMLASSESDELRRMWRDMFDAMPRHDTYPAYSEIRADHAGRVWVADYRPPGEERRMWTVFDPEGRMLGRVRTPDDLRVLEIGEDYILGVARDELDVEHVRVFGLESTGAGGPVEG